jgi:hypothetical protein
MKAGSNAAHVLNRIQHVVQVDDKETICCGEQTLNLMESAIRR